MFAPVRSARRTFLHHRKWLVIGIACVFFVTYCFFFLDASPRNDVFLNASRYETNSSSSSPVIFDSKENWEIRRRIALAQSKKQIRTYEEKGAAFFQNNWEPTVSCAYERRVGNDGDGGKWICDPDRLKKSMLVYSIGSNNDFSFESELYDLYSTYGIEIHTFDFGYAKNKPDFVHYHQIMLSSKDDESSSSRTLRSIIDELGHRDRVIDILKVDIEGSEYDVLTHAMKNGVFESVHQLQLEVHFLGSMTSRRIHEMMAELNLRGMEIFHKEINALSNAVACEFSFVKINQW
jgi:FkbM family methyltransferase